MEKEQFYKSVLDNLFDGIYIVDPERRIIYWNHSAERITGYSSQKVVGSRCHDNILNHVDKDGTLLCNSLCPLAKTLQDGKYREVNAFLHHSDGHRVPVLIRVSPIFDENGKIINAFEIFSDNSTRLAELQKISELEREDSIDPHTRIGNQDYIKQKLQTHLDEYHTSGTPFGILVGDIDSFKKFNDSAGKENGDQILKIVAQTLSNNLRPYDFVGRWAEDQFLLILPIISPIALAKAATRLRLLIQQSGLKSESQILRVTMSIGGTIVRESDTLETLVARADEQLYTCKHAGRNCIRINS